MKKESESPLTGRMAEIAMRTVVNMADYESVPSHKARELLPKSVWRDVLREGCLAILGGESKAKKSWFSLAMAMHVASGREFLGIPIIPGDKPRRVVVLDFELLNANIVSRFVALAGAFEGDIAAWRAIWDNVEIRCHRSLLAEDVPWIEYCAAVVRLCGRGDLMIIDCFQALPAGDVNDPQVVRRSLGMLQAAATESGACVVVVDHFNKSTESKGKNRLSGSMAKAATPDAILLLESDGPNFITFTTELRMDPPRDPMTLEFRSPSEGFRVVGSEEREERKETAKQNRAADRLATLFPEFGRQYTKEELASNAGKSAKTIGEWLKDFGDVVTLHPGSGRNPNRYSRNIAA